MIHLVSVRLFDGNRLSFRLGGGLLLISKFRRKQGLLVSKCDLKGIDHREKGSDLSGKAFSYSRAYSLFHVS